MVVSFVAIVKVQAARASCDLIRYWHGRCCFRTRGHLMPNAQKRSMPYATPQSHAIPEEKEIREGQPGHQGARPDRVTRQENDHPNQLDKGGGTKEAFENDGKGGRASHAGE
jgi:hypothetical protein